MVTLAKNVFCTFGVVASCVSLAADVSGPLVVDDAGLVIRAAIDHGRGGDGHEAGNLHVGHEAADDAREQDATDGAGHATIARSAAAGPAGRQPQLRIDRVIVALVTRQSAGGATADRHGDQLPAERPTHPGVERSPVRIGGS
jgi:hypothetical protein